MSAYISQQKQKRNKICQDKNLHECQDNDICWANKGEEDEEEEKTLQKLRRKKENKDPKTIHCRPSHHKFKELAKNYKENEKKNKLQKFLGERLLVGWLLQANCLLEIFLLVKKKS